MPRVLLMEIGTLHDHMFSERCEPTSSYSLSIMYSCATLTLVTFRRWCGEMCIAVRFCGSNVANPEVCAPPLYVIIETGTSSRYRNVIWSTWSASSTESQGRESPFAPKLWSPKMLLFGPYYAARRVTREQTNISRICHAR